MQNRYRIALVLASILLVASKGSADTLRGYYGSEKVVEKSSELLVSLSPGWAKVTVRREIYNGGSRIDEAIYELEHPSESAAIGLRTKSGVPGASWFNGQLFDARVAEARYRELTGRGEAIPRDPALLYWTSPQSLGLQVFPCAVGKSQWVEYTLLFASSYQDGKYSFELAKMGFPEVPTRITVKPDSSRDWLVLGGVELQPGASATVTSTDDLGQVELHRHQSPLSARFASIGLQSGRTLDRVAIEAAPKISAVPKNAHIVVLLDHSYSMGEPDALLGLYWPLVKAYLSHFEGAKVAIVLFDRRLWEVTAGFVSPEVASHLLRSWPSGLSNGSHLELALARASALLQSTPAGTARRVLLVTDALTRSSLPQERLDGLMRASGAIVHLTDLSPSSVPDLSESPEHPLKNSVEATGGLAWNAAIREESRDLEAPRGAEAAEQIFEELARPRYYRLKAVRVGNHKYIEPDTGDVVLDEGQSWTDDSFREGRPGQLEVRAKLWGRTVSLRVRSDSTEDALGAALATTRDAELTYQELRELAFRGGAVTKLTSYLAVEPGVRPSTAGIDRTGDGIGFGGIGTLGHGAGRGLGRGLGVTNLFEPEKWLEFRLKRAREACGAADLGVHASLETTGVELVDLPELETTPKAAEAESCIAEELWAVELPSVFHRWRRHLWEVQLPAASAEGE